MPIRHLSAFASAKELRKESRWTGDYHVRYILYTYTLKYLYVIIYIHTYIYIYNLYLCICTDINIAYHSAIHGGKTVAFCETMHLTHCYI